MTPSLTLQALADLTGAERQGPADLRLTGVASLEEAREADLSFLVDPQKRHRLDQTHAGAVIVPPGVVCARPHLVSRRPQLDFIKAVNAFAPPEPLPAPGVHPTAVVEPGAVLGDQVAIGPLCVVQAGARLGARTVLVAQVFVGAETVCGEDCRLYPAVVLRERITLGNRVVVHAGTVIGADGFGFAPVGEAYVKVPQVGTVIIGDDVEIGANGTIDRAALGATRIGQGVKIDNLVMIAHNVVVGPHTVMAAQSGISGSTRIGRHAMIGGQVGTVGHIEIGDNAILGAQAGVTRDVAANTFVSGYPARPHKESMRQLGELSRLSQLRKKVAELESRLARLEKP